MWASVTEGGPDEGWAELDENGSGALIGWAAGPENLRRGPVDDSTRAVTVTKTDKVGNVTASVEAFTARDRRIVDEDANSYLADAGVEKRPGGGSAGSSGSPPSSLHGRISGPPSGGLSTRASPNWFIRRRSRRL